MKIDILYREKKIPNFIFQYLIIHALLLFLAFLFTTGAIHAQNYHVEASSEHPGEGFAKHAVDGNLKTYWHTRYGKNRPSQPHYIILDLGRSRRLLGFVYVPRLMGSNGRIGRYQVFIGRTNTRFGNPIHSGEFSAGKDVQKILFSKPHTGRYIKLLALSELNGGPWASITELDVITDLNNIPLVSKVKPQQARSVHLWWQAGNATRFYNEMTINQSHPGSYFVACGFKQGYFGMQEDRNGNKNVVLFSVWDPGNQNDPDSVSSRNRVKLVYKAPDVRVGRFGGEGTGGQSFFTHQWSLNKTYRFMIKSRVRGSKTDFSGYFYLNGQNKWKHLVTFRVETGGQNLSGYYSFVEDFRRDFKSYTEKRSAFWSNGYVQLKSASWKAITRARFTGDNSKPVNINAGIKNNRFFLETGGATINKTRLNSTLQIRPSLNRIIDDLP